MICKYFKDLSEHIFEYKLLEMAMIVVILMLDTHEMYKMWNLCDSRVCIPSVTEIFHDRPKKDISKNRTISWAFK